jgi:hypothetical protein
MASFRLTIDPGSDFDKLRAQYTSPVLHERMAEGVRRGLDRANLIVLSRVQRSRFTGVGPFPVPQQKLGHRSRRLIRSLGASRAIVRQASTLRVGSGIGSNVAYFGVHEFGFEGAVAVPAHQRKMPAIQRTSSKGKQYTIPAGIQSVRAHSRKMKVPARRPLFAGLIESANRETYKDELFTAITDQLKLRP